MIPMAALVGVMFMVVIGTFEWSSPADPAPVPRADALVIITGLSSDRGDRQPRHRGVHRRHHRRPGLRLAAGPARSIALRSDAEGVRTYLVEGVMFFASVTSFRDSSRSTTIRTR